MIGRLPNTTWQFSSIPKSRQYRLHVISRHGSIIRTTTIQCPDDEEASRQALTLAGYNNVDLWQAERKVAKILATKP